MIELRLYAVRGAELLPLSLPDGASELHELFAHVPRGIYSALRTYGGHRFLRLPAHLDRCRRSAERAGWKTQYDYEGLCAALYSAVPGRSAADVRVRFDLLQQPLPGVSADAFVVLGVGPHEPVPEAILRDGAHLSLAPAGLARNQPLIKFTEWVERRAVCKQSEPGAYEYLLLDAEQGVLEGTSSNFYAVRGNRLITAGDGVLEGITRQVTLELAAERGLSLDLSRLPVAQLAQCDEAFITSSTRGIVPVTSVSTICIGTGKVGSVVLALRADYEAYAESHALPAVPRS
jgi:branched-subunit amino acid aminotransferase/4-amino-4-deoxychorismate lyase